MLDKRRTVRPDPQDEDDQQQGAGKRAEVKPGQDLDQIGAPEPRDGTLGDEVLDDSPSE